MSNNNSIKIKGARVHNLKNINVEIPRDKFVVITGLSGSGKSSLAFDTIYAEGQRRYVESLSAYARQFVGLMDKPDVDSIEGLSPAISIDQKTAPHNPRSTVGTITEIYDYMRLLFARIGVPHCPECGKKIRQYTVDEIVDNVTRMFAKTNLTILAPLIKDKKGEHKNILVGIAKAGFSRVRFDGSYYTLDEVEDLEVNKQKKHTVEIVIDRFNLDGNEDRARLAEAVEKALDLGNGLITVSPTIKKNTPPPSPSQDWGGATESKSADNKDITYSKLFACPDCGISLPELEPRNFSFNSPHGACPECSGIGTKLEIDPKLILNQNLTIAQGGIRPWSHSTTTGQTWLMRILGTVATKNGFDLNTLIKDLTKAQLDIVLYGTGKKNYSVDYESERFSGELSTEFEGVVPNLERRFNQTESDWVRKEIEQYMRVLICPSCEGKRLKKEILGVKILSHSIHDVSTKTIDKAKEFFCEMAESKELSAKEKKISTQIIKEICARLDFLNNVGLSYLTIGRAANTLSGGEAQRIRLANQIGTSLVGVLYILDEPSIGLHQRDNKRLIETIKKLRDIGNTVIVVEHDEETMNAADWLIDVGPGAGEHGGNIIAAGTPAQIKKSTVSLTGQYLSGKKSIIAPKTYRKGLRQAIKIYNASEHNLKNIDVEFPLGKLIAITGVSGSGKSTLMSDILAKALSKKFYRAKAEPGKHDRIEGLGFIDKVIDIDQSPIGRTPRSNPATYTGAFTPIRDLFAGLPESKIRGYKAGRFSFNVVGGRCEACSGDGMVKIEMQFLPDVYVECEVCHGHRYNKEALDIFYKGKNISDVLNMTIEEAMDFFKNIPTIYTKMLTLFEVGLGYIKLGQSATTLSGGEAQRIKLASELSRRATGKTLYILDEPTTGLHFEDIKRLLGVLNKLVDKGNTVLIIEHNLDVIKSVDHIIDLGPEGGDKGGYIVAQGTPLEVAETDTHTGKFLKKALG
ncbi:MAG: UvrABC system protein A [Candidatus Falkowbacteria bacterium GW2011_GWC2_38_22]|uniref:UvrABC system protein A n=1 Tax=Candidatus Falkowbacteria bacterium GW2011_GWE1_38_31 TaxID=1618638 RepID=A0A0G0MBT6_9BACT|nr:MAG: UvrABC system protein A [Candidatus Falkowbacteria bacterium GW2011_GWF2_38_1205]KKQ61790.1 MAG: UvrABC system protein A [Candidatus Falkowbacteria bacterium GW2011_GWC2_38_22]KKQ64098.1 MAG: UvrABC system protein A [Candidatus Falkowbacteria bacterium GW2011_GWF1_38_22]KKQ66552.1 MAG: UvrABC system protein A [Candidatus Falkowbacteria bacterium GW2011_GWE2_38_254]KKQ71204.1 MAG: UvrABC system protein A [Candidatus Falkowbacteria bacterium GW2011_GWE1_38_31]KKQ73332.1 MAG: UvrABC syste